MDTLFKDTMAKVQAKILEEGSIRSFAQRLDMNPTTISRWFAEKRSPDFQSLCTILEYFNARIVFPGDQDPRDKEHPTQGSEKPTNLSRQLARALKENSELTKKLDTLRSERDIAIGQTQALKEQIARLAPTPSQTEVAQESIGETHGGSVRAV